MAFTEFILFLVLMLGVYFLLTPLRRRIELLLFSLLRKRYKGKDTIINVTDFTKKEKHPK